MSTITRKTALQALTRVIRISDHLAADSLKALNAHKLRWSASAKFALGLELRRNLLAVQSLAMRGLDDQVLIFYRAIFESVIAMEFLRKKTRRGAKVLAPSQKAFLFLSFPVYCRGLAEPEFAKTRDFQRIARRRKRLVTSDKYWHGSNLRAICIELDDTIKVGKKVYDGLYRDLYSPLSFLAHPNSKENAHLQEDLVTGQIRLRQTYNFAGNVFFATLWAARAMRTWAASFRSGRAIQFDKLVSNWKSTLGL